MTTFAISIFFLWLTLSFIYWLIRNRAPTPGDAIQRCASVEDLTKLSPMLGVTMTPTRYVEICGNAIQIADSDYIAVDRKVLLASRKEIKQKIAEFRLIKNAVVEAQRRRRTAYTSYTRHRGSMVRGGGKLGRLFVCSLPPTAITGVPSWLET